MKNKYEIRGDVTVIFLNRRDGTILETLIDTIDFEKVNSFSGTYNALWKERNKSYYVRANYPRNQNNAKRSFSLHGLLMNAEGKEEVDHINHNTLDNRRSVNLRKATRSENMQNLFASARSKTGIRGVYWSSQNNKWIAEIRLKGGFRKVWCFDDILEAEKKVKEARSLLHPFSQEALDVKDGVIS